MKRKSNLVLILRRDDLAVDLRENLNFRGRFHNIRRADEGHVDLPQIAERRARMEAPKLASVRVASNRRRERPKMHCRIRVELRCKKDQPRAGSKGRKPRDDQFPQRIEHLELAQELPLHGALPPRKNQRVKVAYIRALTKLDALVPELAQRVLMFDKRSLNR